MEEGRHALLDTLVGTRAVVVVDVCSDHALQLLTAKHQFVIQAFAAQAADEAFAECVGLGRLIWSDKFIDTSVGSEIRELAAVLVVAVMYEVIGMPVPGSRFAQLLGNPGVMRCGGDIDMDDPASLQLDEDENVQWPEEQVMCDGEVTGPDARGVILEKRRPGLTGFAGAPRQIALDRALANANAEFEEFTTNTFRTPQTIFRRESLDEVDGFLSNPWPPRRGPRFSPPIAAEELAMPAQQSVRLDDEKSATPVLSAAGQKTQTDAIAGGECRTFDLPVEDDELLTEQGVFGHQIGARAT